MTNRMTHATMAVLLLVTTAHICGETAMNTTSSWKPVALKVQAPTRDVTLADGIWRQAFDANVKALLSSFTADDMLNKYRSRKGEATPPGKLPGWEKNWPGTCSARYLMGAGSALQWSENAELRGLMNDVVDGIEACRHDSGYCMAPGMNAFSPKTTFQWNYCFYTFTIGMVAAHDGGNPKALRLLRDHFDWYNKWVAAWPVGTALKPDLGYQGILAPVRMYFTPQGKPEDVIQAERQFVDRAWVKLLVARDPDAMYKKSPKWPHSNITSQLVGLLELYRATGDPELLAATLGGRDILREHWQHVGGTISLCEHGDFPPKCYPLTSNRHVGEQCASVHWLRLHQRLHQLDPDDETNVAEMEKQIYNAVLAGVALDGSGHQYHNLMEGYKYEGGHPYAGRTPSKINACCEGMGAFACGMLPSFIYSIAPDGLYVDLFAASSILWKHQGHDVKMTMEAPFPTSGDVTLRVSPGQATAWRLHIRCPSWAISPVEYKVNGKLVGKGNPGSYFVLDRAWVDGDTVTFHLPVGFRATLYVGEDKLAGQSRYAIEYGPLLMAAMGTGKRPFPPVLDCAPNDLNAALKPITDKPLHFSVNGNTEVELAPYLQIPWNQRYSCCPILESPKSQK